VNAYKLDAVCIRIHLGEIHDIPVFHPLRNHRKPMVAYCHTTQRHDVWMTEMPPYDCFSAEALTPPRQCEPVGVTMELTRNMLLVSLVRYILMTLTATRIPSCIFLKTLA